MPVTIETNCEQLRRAATEKITFLLDVYCRAEDQAIRQLIDIVLRIGLRYIHELKRFTESNLIERPNYYKSLMATMLDAYYWIDAIGEIAGKHTVFDRTILELLNSTVGFLKRILREEMPASLKANLEVGKTYVLLGDEVTL